MFVDVALWLDPRDLKYCQMISQRRAANTKNHRIYKTKTVGYRKAVVHQVLLTGGTVSIDNLRSLTRLSEDLGDPKHGNG